MAACVARASRRQRRFARWVSALVDDGSHQSPPVPKYVPMNTHVPGTIALSFFTHRIRRP
jgi:hypothetical protein